MATLEIDLFSLRRAVNDVLDHLIEDLRIEKVAIDEKEDFYWEVEYEAAHDTSKKIIDFHSSVGRLSDDVDFAKMIQRGQGGDISYNLVHVAPLLRYIAEKIKD